MRSRRGVFAIGLLGGGLVAALAPLVLLGVYVRPTSDDWCLIPMARSGGFSTVMSTMYTSWNGRLANAAALGAIFTTYDVSSKILPGAMVVLLLLTFYGIWRALLRYAFEAGELVASVCGGALAAGTVLTLLLGKLLMYPTLYHAPTIVSHTMPILIGAAVLVAVLFLHQRGSRWSAAAVALVGGAVLGTFNEAFTAVALVSVAAGVAIWLLLPRHAVHWLVVGAGGLGLVLGFASVWFSPGSDNRRHSYPTGSLFSTQLVHQTLTAWFRIVGYVFTSGEWLLLLLVALAVGVLLGAGSGPVARRHSARFYGAAVVLPALWALLASIGSTFVFVYSFNGQLVGRERVWPSITVSLLLAASWYAVLLGLFVTRRVAGGVAVQRRKRMVVAGVVASLPALALLGLGSAGLVRDEHSLTTKTVVRSVAWDKQQTLLHRQIAAGATSIVVKPLPIDGSYEPFWPNWGWPASCAAGFYGVDKVLHPKLPQHLS